MQELSELREASNDDLIILFDIIVKSSTFSDRKKYLPDHFHGYITHYPWNIKGILPELISDLRFFGGNYLDNFCSGEGPSYSDLLREVSGLLQVNISQEISNEKIENSILKHLFLTTINNCPTHNLILVCKELKRSNPTRRCDNPKEWLNAIWEENSFSRQLFSNIIVNDLMLYITGKEVSYYQDLNQEIKNLLTPGLTFFRFFIQQILDTSDDNYTITVPAIILIASIRQNINNSLKK